MTPTDISKLPGISSRDLHPCDACGQALGPTFRRVVIEHVAMDRRAVDALVGTAQILGGSQRAWGIAQALAPCEPIARVFDSVSVLLCEDCYCTSCGSVPAIAEQTRRSGETKP